jgi:23S rRNA U2552 (ribose-2'-O)-methylase RlmE/FtsJ
MSSLNIQQCIFNIKVEVENKSEILSSIEFSTQENDSPEVPSKEYGFDETLNTHRNKIDKINTDIWKKVRWYINEYDFLVKDPIINRAFYKYWEIINVFNIFEKYTDSDTIFHCAEAPGGFIQGSNIYLQLENFKPIVPEPEPLMDEDGWMKVGRKKKSKKQYKIYTISLNKDLPQYKSYNLPSYNKRVINKNICVTYGKDNTGDINNLENIHHIKHLIGQNGSYLVTADGGFDEGTDFNNKEQLHYYLILNEIYSALCLQKQGGHFILKVFDIFTKTSMHLLYLLNLVYDEIYIYKPKTSRPTNSEKYIICKNLNEYDKNSVLKVLRCLSENFKTEKKYTSFALFDEIPEDFINKVKQMNITLLNKQCEALKKAIDLCENTDFIKNYDLELESSLDRRRRIFKQWEELYNLNCYIPS